MRSRTSGATSGSGTRRRAKPQWLVVLPLIDYCCSCVLFVLKQNEQGARDYNGSAGRHVHEAPASHERVALRPDRVRRQLETREASLDYHRCCDTFGQVAARCGGHLQRFIATQIAFVSARAKTAKLHTLAVVSGSPAEANAHNTPRSMGGRSPRHCPGRASSCAHVSRAVHSRARRR